MTGTPVQNRLADLSTMFQFLRVYPYSEPKVFEEQISKPWKKGDAKAVTRLRAVVRCIALRRPKDVIELPERMDNVRTVTFNEEERQVYESVKASTTSLLDNAISMETRDNSLYLSALQRINSLRMICNLGLTYRGYASASIIDQPWNQQSAQKTFGSMESAGTAICTGCSLDLGLGLMESSGLSEIEDRVYITECALAFCNQCYRNFRQQYCSEGNICHCASACRSYQVTMSDTGSNATTLSSSQLERPSHISSKVASIVAALKELGHAEKRLVYRKNFRNLLTRAAWFSPSGRRHWT